jgi:predicted nucleic acid-binding protein
LIFVDTNVFMYAVGRDHPLRDRAREFFAQTMQSNIPRVTSAEVLQELLHAYLSTNRLDTFDAALDLIDNTITEIWAVEAEDILLARMMADWQHGVGARGLLHLACCRRRGVDAIQTFDHGLAQAFLKK